MLTEQWCVLITEDACSIENSWYMDNCVKTMMPMMVMIMMIPMLTMTITLMMIIIIMIVINWSWWWWWWWSLKNMHHHQLSWFISIHHQHHQLDNQNNHHAQVIWSMFLVWPSNKNKPQQSKQKTNHVWNQVNSVRWSLFRCFSR